MRSFVDSISGFPSGGGGQPITNAGPAGFKGAKNDLISELKLSHAVGGISKLKTEQQKQQECQEKEQYKKFLAQFTMENFLEKVRNDRDRVSRMNPDFLMLGNSRFLCPRNTVGKRNFNA